MMTSKKLIQHVIAFVVLTLIGAMLAFIGLRLYYNDARLQQSLGKSYNAKAIQVLAGQAKLDGDDLVVSSVSPEGLSFVNVGQIRIDSRFYDSLTISFKEKHAQQPLFLAVRHQQSEVPIEKRLSYSNDKNIKIELSHFVPDEAIITDVGLLAPQILDRYSIQSIGFSPKVLSHKAFFYLLWDCFAINEQWENWSINTHRSPYPVLISPKILVLIIFIVVGILFAIYLRLVKVPVINAWWVTAIVGWFTLDVHYLVEKTVITKNVYDTYAHLSDDEKDLVLSPEAAKLAQAIKSVLPEDGERKKIRIQFGWEEKWLRSKESEKRYMAGKIQYYLYPHSVYTLSKKIPEEVWQQGGFYYVDANRNFHLSYDSKKRIIMTPFKQPASVTRLFVSNDIIIYYVKGVSHPLRRYE